jgi:hypothetical protein
MNKLKNNLTILSTFLSGVVGHHYIGKILDYSPKASEMAASKETELRAISESENMEIMQNKLNSIIKNNESLSKNVETLIDKHVPESQLSNVNELLDFGGKQCQTVREILDCCAGPDNINLDFYQAAYRAAVACENANREASESVKKLVDSINGSNKLVLRTDFNLKYFYEYLNSLNLLELSALYHILVLVVIAILSFNVLSAVLGNEIIKYFKLEESFPKLAAFLRLRLKFQKYYLTLSFSLIFLLIFASIQINLLVLF